jgi:hypothetical protein
MGKLWLGTIVLAFMIVSSGAPASEHDRSGDYYRPLADAPTPPAPLEMSLPIFQYPSTFYEFDPLIQTYLPPNDTNDTNANQPIWWSVILAVFDWVWRGIKDPQTFATIVLAILTFCYVKSTLRQTSAIRRSAIASVQSARAARIAAEIAEHALVKTEPAFLFHRGVAIAAITGVDGHIRGWRFMLSWHNSGSTPAKGVLMNTGLYWVDKVDVVEDVADLPREFDFPDTYGFREPTDRVRLSIGPGGEIAGDPKDIEISELERAYHRQCRIFIWGWVDYNDIFPQTPRHRTEYCFEIVVSSDPSRHEAGTSTFMFFAYGTHNGIEEECYRKAGEKARQVLYNETIWPLQRQPDLAHAHRRIALTHLTHLRSESSAGRPA